MKAFYRIACGVAAVLISLGLLLSLVGFLIGGRVARLDEVVFPLHGSWRIGPFNGWGNPLYGSDTIDTVYPGGITQLDFDLSCADVTIKTGDAFRVEAKKINAKRFRTEVDGDTWEIECDTKNVNRMSGDKVPTITITLPRSFVAEDAELALSMGDLTVKNLSARESSLEVGMGNLIATGFSSGDCEITIGMGSLELAGMITGQGFISCGMGSAELMLAGNPQDYGYNVTVGMGSVEINGEDISSDGLPPIGSEVVGGFGAERSWNLEAPNRFTIDCGMGSVELTFREG